MKCLPLLWLLVLPLKNHAQDATVLLAEAQAQESSFREIEALQKYTQIVRIQPSHFVALCKCSELCSRIGNRLHDRSGKADYFRAARTYAVAALRVNPNHTESNFVMAMAMGRLALISSGREKLIAVNDIRAYVEKSIRLDPSNFKPYHIMGKWNYEVSNLSFGERTMAKWFFGGVPQASLQEAIAYYEKSRALNPGFVLNYLELSRAYYRFDQKKKAKELLARMMQLPDLTIDDPHIKEEGRSLLISWGD
jgi:tetratricopeptide (TPR) repeat protein